MGNPVNLLKYLFRYLLKLLNLLTDMFLYLKQNDKMGHFNKRIGQKGNGVNYLRHAGYKCLFSIGSCY